MRKNDRYHSLSSENLELERLNLQDASDTTITLTPYVTSNSDGQTVPDTQYLTTSTFVNSPTTNVSLDVNNPLQLPTNIWENYTLLPGENRPFGFQMRTQDT